MGATTSNIAHASSELSVSTGHNIQPPSTTTSTTKSPPLQVEIVQPPDTQPPDTNTTMAGVLYYTFHALEMVLLGVFAQYLLNQLDPRSEGRESAAASESEMARKLRKLNRSHINAATLTQHERQIFTDIVEKGEVSMSFDQIGGLQKQKEQIMNSLTLNQDVRNSLRAAYGDMSDPPRGILLHGKPGCGKTLLAKAIATECDAVFIALKISHVTDKWHGESQKLTDAVFSLARKLAPAIVFIDEVETFLRDRGMPGASMESATTGQMKASFLSNWDGLKSNNTTRVYRDPETDEIIRKQLPFEVVVIGATNRAGDIDEAFHRRMSLQLQLDLPNLEARTHILDIMFQAMPIRPCCQPADIACSTAHYSGSDLKELCRRAVMEKVNEVMRRRRTGTTLADKLQPLTRENFVQVLKSMQPAGDASVDYKNKQRNMDMLKNNGMLGGIGN